MQSSLRSTVASQTFSQQHRQDSASRSGGTAMSAALLDAESEFYEASLVKPKRRRGTKSEMEERAEFLIDYAEKHGPVTVRGLYYQAEVNGVAGIGKDEQGYSKVQRQVLKLRRGGCLAYEHIADATRWMRKPRSYESVEEALRSTAALYRKALWADADDYVEIWLEKDAISGVIYEVTQLFDVPLMVARGYSSETFCFEAIEQRGEDRRPYWVYYLGDFDRSGLDAARTLNEKLQRFASEKDIPVIFRHLAVTEEQVKRLGLPTRKPKREHAADKKWPFDFACEIDAIEPDELRDLMRDVIELHLPPEQYRALKVAEESERQILRNWIGRGGAPR
jgi:hypothetical protein